MLLIRFGHGRWDVSFDRDPSTDKYVEWTNVSAEPVDVELTRLFTSSVERFTIKPGGSYRNLTGCVLRVIDEEPA